MNGSAPGLVGDQGTSLHRSIITSEAEEGLSHLTAQSAKCLCMFCGARKKHIVDACAECSRRPQSEIELAKVVLVSSPAVEVEGRWLGLDDVD